MGFEYKYPSTTALAGGWLASHMASNALRGRPYSGENMYAGKSSGMPYFRRTYRRRLGRKRRGRRRQRKARVASLGIPMRKMIRLRTSQNTILNPGNGTLATATLSLNSIYDPTGSLGTRQPKYSDQWAAFYARYCVVGWRVKIEVLSTDNTNGVVVGFTPHTSSTALASYLDYKESRGTVSCIVTPDIDKNILVTKGSVKKWLMPQGGRILSEYTLTGGRGATADADPAQLLYGHLWAQEINANADPAQLTLVITLEQLVCYFSPYNAAAS